MCGIYGNLGLWHSPEQGLAALQRRGPDQQAYWGDAEAGIWLGHTRLSILDLSTAGNQPMHSPDSRWVMVYNGEIYNFQALRAELESVGEAFCGHSDSEVLLRLFMREGTSCLTKLNGIFSVAFWDRKEQTLTLARDPMGVKPLYFSQWSNGFAFASEIKALVRSGDVVPSVNPTAVLHHLGLLWSPGRDTIVSGVHKLLPGEVCIIKGGAVVSNWIFCDPVAPQADRLMLHSVADATRRVHDTVEAAVQRQLVSDVPLGVFLSGGLDSSSIAAFAARHRTGLGKLQCFTIEIGDGLTSAEGFADDLPYARRVADHLNVDLHVVKADRSMLDRLPEMIYHLDEPTADLAAMNTLLISELARSEGITVLLSGAGGDDIFSGYRRHYALMQERYWSWLPASLRGALASATGLLPKNASLSRRISKAFHFAGCEPNERLAGYFSWLPPTEAYALLSPELRSMVTPESMLRPLLGSLKNIDAQASSLQKLLYLECKHFLADHNLNYADKMGMAASIEIRVPLLDHDLVDLAMSIPDEMKQRGRTSKWILKRAMEAVLPKDVIYRPKTGFGVPLRQWLVGPLDPLVQDTLSPHRITRRGVFDAKAVQQLIAANKAGTVDGTYTIFAILCLEIWFSQFIDGHFAVN